MREQEDEMQRRRLDDAKRRAGASGESCHTLFFNAAPPS